MLQKSNNKAIFTGNHHEYFTYLNPYFYGYAKKPKTNYVRVERGLDNEANNTLKALYVKVATSRAKNKMRRLVHGNQYVYDVKPKLLTLTFKENLQDIKTANRHFSNFIKRFTRKVGYPIRYLAVHEFQKRGALHYHVILFNVPVIEHKQIAKVWGHGIIDIEVVKDNTLHTYMTKYISKSFSDPKCKHSRRYFYSLDNKSIILTNHNKVLEEKKKEDDKDLLYKPIFREFKVNDKPNAVVKSEYLVRTYEPYRTPGQLIKEKVKVEALTYRGSEAPEAISRHISTYINNLLITCQASTLPISREKPQETLE